VRRRRIWWSELERRVPVRSAIETPRPPCGEPEAHVAELRVVESVHVDASRREPPVDVAEST
jgi:hypothetical protein